MSHPTICPGGGVGAGVGGVPILSKSNPKERGRIRVSATPYNGKYRDAPSDERDIYFRLAGGI